MQPKIQFMYDVDDAGGAEPAAEPQSVAEAIAANPDRFSSPDPEPELEAEPTSEAPAEEVESEDPVSEPAVPDDDQGELSTELETETPEPTEDPFQDFGGREVIEQAHRLYEASKTQEGLIDIFIQAGTGIGLSLDQLETLFGKDEVSAASGEDEYSYDDDPERPVTYKELQELQQRQEQQRQQAEAQRQAEQAKAVVTQTVERTLTELGIEPGTDEMDAVIKFADDHYTPGTTDPAAVQAALRQGKAKYDALIEQARRGYVAEKEKAAKVPSSPAGNAAPKVPDAEEPRDTAEAIRIAREGFRSGRFAS